MVRQKYIVLTLIEMTVQFKTGFKIKMLFLSHFSKYAWQRNVLLYVKSLDLLHEK